MRAYKGTTTIYRIGVREDRRPRGAKRQQVIWVVLQPSAAVSWSRVRGFCCHKGQEIYGAEALRYMGNLAGCYDEFLVDGTLDLQKFVANLAFGESVYEAALWMLRIKDDWPKSWKQAIGSVAMSATPRTDLAKPTTEAVLEDAVEDLKPAAQRLVNVLTHVIAARGRQAKIAARPVQTKTLAEMAAELTKIVR